MSRKISVNAIVYVVMVILLVNLLMNYTYTPTSKNTRGHSNCERYHNWAWIHAPRDGLVSQINDLGG